MRRIWAAIGFCLCVPAMAAAPTPTQFWNQSKRAVVSLRLSHAGTGEYGDNVALGREVAHDGRIDIVNLPSGRYDLEVKFKDGRSCFARHIAIIEGKPFSIPDKELVRCAKR